MRYAVALLLMGCSGGAMETTAEPSESVEKPKPSAYQVGDTSPIGPMPGTCEPGCELIFPEITSAPQSNQVLCASLGPSACGQVSPGWIGSVPECGATELWLTGCVWNPSGTCVVGPFYEAWQGCKPL